MIWDFFRRSRVANFAVPDPILQNLEHVQAFMDVLVPCKNKEDPIKIEALERSQDYSLTLIGS